jgi:hypothetical protein
MPDGKVPAFLSIDVEPDAFQLSRGEPADWAGFDAMVPFIEVLRGRLAAHSDTAPVFGWYFRTDPQIAEIYGRADHALQHYADRIKELLSTGDYIGAHPHPLRWSEAHRAWVHELTDGQWLRDCTLSALDVFAETTGAPARHMRFGAGFINDETVKAAEDRGVLVDLTLEPVAGWGLDATVVQTSVDSSPIVGRFVNCETAPSAPYQPERDEFRVAIAYGKRTITLVPLSSVMAATQLNAQPTRNMLYPSVPWPSVNYFWDLALQQLRSMERPYLSLAVRTDTYDMALTAGVRRIFEALPEHEISTYLRWVDPLQVLDELVTC